MTSNSKRSLLAKCLIASLALHSLALLYFWKYPIALQENYTLFLSKTAPSPIELEEQNSEDLEMKEFFEEEVLAKAWPSSSSPLLLSSSPSEEMNENLTLSLPFIAQSEVSPEAHPLGHEQETLSLALSSSFEHALSLEEPSFSQQIPSPSMQAPDLRTPQEFLAMEHASQTPFLDDRTLLQEELASPSFPSKEGLPFSNPSSFCKQTPSLLSEKNPAYNTKELIFLLPSTTPLPLAVEKDYPLSVQDPHELIAQSSFADIEEYLPFQALFSLDWSQKVTLTPSFFAEEDGYVFSLELTPIKNLETERMPQHFYFLIDVSSDIDKHKIPVFKKSVLKALTALQPQDTFNIFLLDKELESLSPQNLSFSLHSLHLAEEFLERKQSRNFFSSFHFLDAFKESLNHVHPDEETHTLILLTGGQLDSNATTIQKALKQLRQERKGQFCLFAATAGKNNQLVHLDLLTSLFGGKVLYSDTHASFPRKLTSLVKTLQDPLAKELLIQLQSTDDKTQITDLSIPSSSFYAKTPFVIMGKINKLSPLQLLVEGKNSDHTVLIHKQIAFEEAKETAGALKKEWLLRRTSALYEQFLADGNPLHLKKAQEILQQAHGRNLGQ